MDRADALVAGGIAAVGTLVALAVHWVPSGRFASTTHAQIQTLHWRLLVVAVPIAVFVEAVLLYTVVRFRHTRDPKPTPENRRLEIGWTVATAIVLVFVGVVSYQALASPDVTAIHHHDQADHGAGQHALPAEALEVRITGQQWYWTVEYVGENVSIRHAQTIYLPVDRPIYLTVTSNDVIHSVHVPGLGLKQDAIPGQESVIRTEPTRLGEYRLYCAEYCGVGHSEMRATIVVASGDDYRQWLASERAGD